MLSHLCAFVGPLLPSFDVVHPNISALPVSPSSPVTRRRGLVTYVTVLSLALLHWSSRLLQLALASRHASALVSLVDGSSPLGSWTPTLPRYWSRDTGFGARFPPPIIPLHLPSRRLLSVAHCLIVRRYHSVLTGVWGRQQVPLECCSFGLPTLALCHVTTCRRHSFIVALKQLWVAHVGVVPRAHLLSPPPRHHLQDVVGCPRWRLATCPLVVVATPS